MTPQDESYSEFLDRVAGPLPAGEVDPDTPQDAPIRGLQDDFQANRVARQLKHLAQDEAADMAYVLAEQVRLWEWFHARQKPRASKRLWLEGLLRGYYEYLKEQGKVYLPKRRKSHTPYALPDATLEAYYVSVDFEVVKGKEDEFLEWCAANGLTRVKVEPRWVEAKKLFNPTEGECVTVTVEPGIHDIVPGVQVKRQASEGFRVKLTRDITTEDEPEGE